MILTKRASAMCLVLVLFFITLATTVPAHAKAGLKLAVIAHSVSTRTAARNVLRSERLSEESNLQEADGILVVLRSKLNNPLSSSYDSIQALDDDVESQLNIGGSDFHVYIYLINDDLSVNEVKHVYYEPSMRGNNSYLH